MSTANDTIKPITLGKLQFPTNIIQGPLAGYSNAVFRALTWKYGSLSFSCTEMLSAKALLHRSNTVHQRYIKKDPNEGPVCFQLSGNNPAELSEAAKMVTDYGADLIDLNCGCPVKKIRSKGVGSSLLEKPSLLYELICSLKRATHVPVSIKIRVEGFSDDKFNENIAKVVSDAGADYLIVHGRHWSENYDTPCNYEQIKFFVSTLAIPVIGNGDISCINSLKQMFATGCAGVMIARAGVGQPWLTKKLKTELQQESFDLPANIEIGVILLDHVHGLIELFGNEKFAIVQSRKLAKYYARGLSNKVDFINRINLCNTITELNTLVTEFFR